MRRKKLIKITRVKIKDKNDFFEEEIAYQG